MSKAEDAIRMEEILCELKTLMEEAMGIMFRYRGVKDRFGAYPYANIMCALDRDHGYLGGAMYTFADCVKELQEDDDDDL